jgi:hypothetical protein
VPIPPVRIADEDLLYRRLAPSGHLNPDGTVASNAFKLRGRPDAEPSVDLARLTTPSESRARAGRPGFQLGVLRAGDVRALGLTVTHEPTEDNPSHCLVRGNATGETCKKLAERTRVLLAPDEG